MPQRYYILFSNSFIQINIDKFGDKPIFEVHTQGTKIILYSTFGALSIDMGYFVAQASKVQQFKEQSRVNLLSSTQHYNAR